MAEAHGEAGEEVVGEEAVGEEAVADAPPFTGSGDLVSDTLAYLARSIVDHPDDVRVELTQGERGPLYRLHVHPDDVGRVIGKGGRVARAIRQVTRAAAARAGTHAWIEISG